MTGLPQPRLSYLVCATPRSGSTLLCQALASTGIAGVPEEFFEARAETGEPRRPSDHLRGANDLYLPEVLSSDEPPEPAPYSSLKGVRDYRQHLRKAFRHGTTPNGVFGAKLMWTHLEDFAVLARTLPELEGAPIGTILASLFPGARYVWVSRRDRIRQAVSLWRALQTQAWRAKPGTMRGLEGRYNFAGIDHLRYRLTAQEAGWQRWFKHEAIEPLHMYYEDFAADLPAAVATVLYHLGLDVPSLEDLRAPLERQSDRLSDEWVERYHREHEELTKEPATVR